MTGGEGVIHLVGANEDITLTLTRVAALVDDFYAREHVLLSCGLNSYRPLLRFSEVFSESPEELKEYRDFTIANAKNSVVTDPKFLAQWDQLNREAQERHKATGNLWDLELLSLKKRWRRRRLEMDESEIYRMLRPYKEERARLWAIEVGRYAGALSEEFEAKSKSRMALYKAVMQQEQERTGLIPDRETSTARAPVYSMAFGQDWKLCLRLDHVVLAKPYLGPYKDAKTGEVFPGGVHFELSMEIRRRVKNGGEFARAAPLRFEWLFPIAVGLFGPASYSEFTSLRELEALIRIHIQMFLLIREDLKRALLAGST